MRMRNKVISILLAFLFLLSSANAEYNLRLPKDTIIPICDDADFSVVYLGGEIYNQFSKNLLLLHFAWTNKSEEAKSRCISFSFRALQNGIELNPDFVVGFESEFFTSITQGTTLDFYVIYKLRNTENSIIMSLDKFADYNDEFENVIFTINLK